MAKYLDPERTLALAVLAVPDAVHAEAPEAHAEGWREGVLVVPYSLALPFVLSLYRLTVRFASAPDTEEVAARLARLSELLQRMDDEVEGRLSRALVQAAKRPRRPARRPGRGPPHGRAGSPGLTGPGRKVSLAANRMQSLAILVAAGRGERMGPGRPKAFLELAGQALVLRAALVFDAAPSVEPDRRRGARGRGRGRARAARAGAQARRRWCRAGSGGRTRSSRA